MNITLTIPDSVTPAWNRRLDQFNAGSGQPPITLTEFFQRTAIDEPTPAVVAAYQVARREALIPIADEILATTEEKQQAAVAAALAAVRN
jgi:hypothetical protein